MLWLKCVNCMTFWRQLRGKMTGRQLALLFREQALSPRYNVRQVSNKYSHPCPLGFVEDGDSPRRYQNWRMQNSLRLNDVVPEYNPTQMTCSSECNIIAMYITGLPCLDNNDEEKVHMHSAQKWFFFSNTFHHRWLKCSNSGYRR